jgi:lipoate-protein ligase A
VVQSLPYDAEALSRFEREGPFTWLWEPTRNECVLGAGTPETDINESFCTATGVPIYRRRGGGGAVLLSPGNLVITACYDARKKAFATGWILPIAEAVVRALASLGVKGAHVRGLGDVAIGEQKILGSSLYANRQVALFQGSLLVDSDLDLIARYLPHPSKEPDYRRGRSHLDFVTTLRAAGYRLDPSQLHNALEVELQQV